MEQAGEVVVAGTPTTFTVTLPEQRREQGGRRVNRIEPRSEVKIKAVATLSGGMMRDVTRTDGKPISAVFAKARSGERGHGLPPAPATA